MSHVLHVERRRQDLFRADHLRESILTKAMGWFFGCFGRNKERVPALQRRGNVHRRSKFSHGYQPFRQQNSSSGLGSRPLLREDNNIKYSAKSGEYSCSSKITSDRLLEGKQSSLVQVDELEEEVAKLKRKLAEEVREAQKLREEVKNLRSSGVLLQTPDELRKVPVRSSEDVLLQNWHSWLGPGVSPIRKIKLHLDSRTAEERSISKGQLANETVCRNAQPNEVSVVSQTHKAESKAATLGAITIADSENHHNFRERKILSTHSSCKSRFEQDVMLPTRNQAQLAENICLQQGIYQDISKSGVKQSLKTAIEISSTTTQQKELDLQAVTGISARPSFPSASAESDSCEGKKQLISLLDPTKISSQENEVSAVKLENEKFTDISRTMTLEEETPANQPVAKLLPSSMQAWRLTSFLWRQPLSPVHETESLLSSEEDTCRQSGSSLVVSSGRSSRDCTDPLEEFAGTERKLIETEHPNYLVDFNEASGLPGKLASPEQPCVRSIMQSTSESCDTYSSENVASDNSECFDDSEFDIVPIQCLSPQMSPMCKKHYGRNRMAKEANRKRHNILPVCLTSSPPENTGKENQAAKDMSVFLSGIHNASASKEELLNPGKAARNQTKSTVSVLKPVENLSEWRKLKQSISELIADQTCSLYDHEPESLGLRAQFFYKDSEENPLDRYNLVNRQQVSKTWDPARRNDNFDLDESEVVDRRLRSSMTLRRACARYSEEYSVDSNSPDFEYPSSQLNEQTEHAVGIPEGRELFCEELERINEESDDLDASCLSAESTDVASPYMTWKHKHFQQAFENSPSERPIIGTVAAHWVFPESAEPQKWWDGKGIPNSTTKYKEKSFLRNGANLESWG
ncbi:hypothetical protein O6H91_23G052400 [Diphasiastrum complanatum]|uniref:Uncharacterized protein n=2 Tax=Diphasiastrum complanatum TaxID=34168 RepID=A0ACC2AAM7_DIPCM|nr:hypothetical protein O6H91_23G050400 [Diphasiastrum complanatum]KAJ7514617.1 hypothetical protein O6H91_23G052400 [Diphasiastrum complanatum]